MKNSGVELAIPRRTFSRLDRAARGLSEVGLDGVSVELLAQVPEGTRISFAEHRRRYTLAHTFTVASAPAVRRRDSSGPPNAELQRRGCGLPDWLTLVTVPHRVVQLRC